MDLHNDGSTDAVGLGRKGSFGPSPRDVVRPTVVGGGGGAPGVTVERTRSASEGRQTGGGEPKRRQPCISNHGPKNKIADVGSNRRFTLRVAHDTVPLDYRIRRSVSEGSASPPPNERARRAAAPPLLRRRS